MSNITPEQAAEMQDRVNRLAGIDRRVNELRLRGHNIIANGLENIEFVGTQTPHIERKPKTAAKQGRQWRSHNKGIKHLGDYQKV